MSIFETLNKLSKKETSERNGNDHSVTEETTKRKDPSYIYLDEQTNQIKEIPLTRLDSAGSALINRTMNYKNPAKLIHEFMFGK